MDKSQPLIDLFETYEKKTRHETYIDIKGNFDRKVYNRLAMSGYKTIQDVTEGFETGRIVAVRNFGKKGFLRMIELLTVKGFTIEPTSLFKHFMGEFKRSVETQQKRLEREAQALAEWEARERSSNLSGEWEGLVE